VSKEDRLREIEMKYMERFERGEAPTLEELIEYYPDLSEELTNFVLDFIALEKAAERTELSEDEVADAMTVQEQAIEKALKPVGSFKELRVVAGKKLETLAKAVHLPMSVLDGLERGMLVLDSVPAKLFERLGRSLGRAPAEILALLQAGNRQLRPVHWKAETTPKRGKSKAMSFEEALRASKEFKASEEEYRRDWLSEAG
jgi:transcriptional regulator with XRE-family HTH domain